MPGRVSVEVRHLDTTAPGLLTPGVWLAESLAHGLIRSGFVPDAPIQVMRALLHYCSIGDVPSDVEEAGAALPALSR